MGKRDRKPYTWEVVQDFTDPGTGITLRVSRNDASPPGYSWQQGNKPTDGTADERLRPFNRLRVAYANNTDPCVGVSGEIAIIVGLMAEMQTWVELDAKAQVEALVRKKKEDTKKKANAVNGPRPEVFGKAPRALLPR